MVRRMGGRQTADKKRRKNFVLGSPEKTREFILNFYNQNKFIGISIQNTVFASGQCEGSHSLIEVVVENEKFEASTWHLELRYKYVTLEKFARTFVVTDLSIIVLHWSIRVSHLQLL